MVEISGDPIQAYTKYMRAQYPELIKIIRSPKLRGAFTFECAVAYKNPAATAEEKKEYATKISLVLMYYYAKDLKKNRLSSADFADALQNHFITALHVLQKFDPEKATMQNFLAYLSPHLKSSTKVSRRENHLIKKPFAVVAKEMADLRKTSVSDLLVIPTKPLSINIDDLTDVVYSTEIDKPQPLEDKLVAREQIGILEYALSQQANVLTTRERVIIVLKYGVFGHEKNSLQSISNILKAMGLPSSVSRVSQLSKSSLTKLLKYFKKIMESDPQDTFAL